MNTYKEYVALNYEQACEFLRKSHLKKVKLGWNIDSDEFFRIFSELSGIRANVKKEGEHFTLTIKELDIS